MYFQFLKTNPNDYQVNKQVGGIFLHNGNYQQAIKYMDKALEVNPSDKQVIADKEKCLKVLGDRKK